jgi:hypothetical protein
MRVIKRDNRSRERVCVKKMRNAIELDTLEERRHSIRLILMYKVVEGLVPALPTDAFVTFSKRKRHIKPKTFEDCTLYIKMRRMLCRLSSSVSSSISFLIFVIHTLSLLLLSLLMKRIARFCIFSNLSMFPLRYGFQIVAPYYIKNFFLVIVFCVCLLLLCS